MKHLQPNGHEEIHVHKGLILLTAHSEGMLGKAEFDVLGNAKDITFNDVYVTYTDENGVKKYRDLNGWYIKVYVYEKEPPAKKTYQITFFDLLGG